MLIAPRYYAVLLAATCILLLFFASLQKWKTSSVSVSSVPFPVPSPSGIPSDGAISSAGNATLGFQKILALSAGPSWRTKGLKAAADLVGIEIDIPPQPPIDASLVDAFQALGSQDSQHPSHGASAAWLAHLDLIKHVLQSNYDTALIIEDDVDWDRSLRQQMVHIAEGVRNLTKTNNDGEANGAPYGRVWDVLWIGNCGEYWEEGIETVIFDDTAVCPHSKYYGWAGKYLSRLPDNKRAVYWSYNPVCSFAYGLSRTGAWKVLREVGGAKDEGFDVAMMRACRDKKLNCISVVPEVIHQYFPSQDFGVKSLVDIGNGEKAGPKDDEFESIIGSTENILESARCYALWGKTCLRE